MVIELTAELPGPADAVWELITDWENQGDWMLEARDFVVVSPHRRGLGVEAEATVSIGGVSTRDRVRVVEWHPGFWLGIDHLGWVSGRGELFLTPTATQRTHLVWREELHPPLGLIGAAGMTLFRPLMKRIFARDLRVLQSLVRVRTRSSG